MDKKLIVVPLLLLTVLALGPDDYVCLKYSQIEGCISASKLPAEVVYGNLQLSGAFTDSGASMQYSLSVNSLTDDYALVSLISGYSIGIRDLQVDGKQTGLVLDGSMYAVPVKGKGIHQVTFNVILGTVSSGVTETAQFQLPLNISYTQIQMQIPAETSLDIQPHLTQETSGNTVTAQVGPTSQVVMTLTKVPISIVETKEPKIYADVNTLVTMKEAAISVMSTIDYNVLHTGVALLEVRLPSDTQVVDVSGPDDWKVSDYDGGKKVQFIYKSAMTGQFSVYITYEKSFKTPGYTTDVPELMVIGAERERGFVGVMADTAIEVNEVSFTGLTKIDPTELPQIIWMNSIRPVVLAYKYLQHPWSLSLEASKHEELPVLIATVDRADLISLMAGDKMLTKYTLYVKNNRKQYLELSLPAGAEVWSTFVDNQPVKPVKDGEKVKIPLIKSVGTDTLQSFPVEIVYISDSSSFWVWYRFLSTPTIDLPISQLGVSIYMPQKEVPWFVYTDLEAGAISSYYQQLIPMPGAMAPSRNIMDMEEQVAVTEMVQVAKEKGVLPVQVEVPTQGNLIELKKMLVVSDTPSSVFIIQIHDAISTILGWALLLYLTYAFQAVVFSSVNKKELKKSTIIWSVAIFILLNWVMWQTSWMLWVIISIGLLIAGGRLVLGRAKVPGKRPRKR